MKLKNIFMSKDMKEKVEEIHGSFYPLGEPTLLWAMAQDQMRKKISQSEFDELSVPLVTHSVKFNSTSVPLDMKEISVLTSRREYIHDLIRDYGLSETDAELNSEELDVYEIEDLSLRCWTPTQALAFKSLVLERKLCKKYMGIQAQTEPVKRAERILFGKASSNLYRHTLLCINIAEELGTSPTYINTALWVIGRRES